MKKAIRAGAIYARTEDINTPREKTANVVLTEYLWKKRFGYDLQPYDRYYFFRRIRSNFSRTSSFT